MILDKEKFFGKKARLAVFLKKHVIADGFP